MLWILNLADGTNDLISISEKSHLPISQLVPVIDKLLENGMLEMVKDKRSF
jgi:aminopeptidase-like protein